MSSRLSVAASGSLRYRGLRFVLRRMLCLCHFQCPICADSCAKHARFATFKKVMCFVFNHFLASFPRFLYFLARLRISAGRAMSNPCRIPPLRIAAGTCAAPKSSNCAVKAYIERSICDRFRFLFSFVPEYLSLFSITYWLRSYYFLSISSFQVSRTPGHSRQSSRLADDQRLSAAMCP